MSLSSLLFLELFILDILYEYIDNHIVIKHKVVYMRNKGVLEKGNLTERLFAEWRWFL